MDGIAVGPSLKKHIVVLTVLLLRSFGKLNGAVIISPSGMVTVCSGDQLEFICMITNPGADGFTILQWNTTLELNTTSPMSYNRIISSSSPTDQYQQFGVNSTTFTLSRISALNEFPLVSRLLINPVTNGLSVRCKDDISLESSTSIISITNGHPIQDTEGANLTEEYGIENDGVTVTLEWAQTDPTYFYQVAVVPNLPLNFSISTHVWIRVPYNSPHNVSIIASSCGKHNATVFFKKVFYSKCVNPILTGGQVSVLGFTEPAVEDSMVVFACPARLELSGPNTSICTGNGEWEPDPMVLTCIGTTTLTTGSPPSHGQLPIVGTIVGSLFGVLLLSIIIVILVIIILFLKGRRKDGTDFSTTEPQLECVNTAELSPLGESNGHNNSNVNDKGLVYAEIGQLPFNQSQQPQHYIPALDDTPIEYAKINHKSLESNKHMSQINDDSLRVNLDNLLIQLRPQVSPKWYQFGEAAGIRKDVLDKLAKQCSPEDCIVEMLDYWLRNTVERQTWKDIANILRAINLLQLAHDIEGVYSTGKLPIEINLNWISHIQDADVELKSDSPPPIPPKIMVPSSSQHSVQCHIGNDDPMPALPPKPTVMNVPPRPPK